LVLATAKQVRVVDNGSNLKALGKVITQTKELLKTRVDVFVFYLQITLIGTAIFAALFFPTVLGIKASNLKNEITQYDISISRMSAKINEIRDKIKTIEASFPDVREIRENGKIYKIMSTNAK
jgi:hypothetical protein